MLINWLLRTALIYFYHDNLINRITLFYVFYQFNNSRYYIPILLCEEQFVKYISPIFQGL